MEGNISVRARRRRTEWLLQQSHIAWGDDDAPEHGGDDCAAPTPACKPSAATPAMHAEKPRNLDRRYSRIADSYHSVDQVTEALAQAGLENSNLIVGIDFTKRNEWTGKFSFHGRSLHYIRNTPNLYEQAVLNMGRTLSKFDDDNLIPCFGFGDASTHDEDVFCFSPDARLDRYREIVPHLRLDRARSFAQIIEMAITIVNQNGEQYQVPLITTNGELNWDWNWNWKRIINDKIREVTFTEKRKEEILLAALGRCTEGISVPNPGSQEDASALRLVLDSGASMHAVGDKRILQGYRPLTNPWLVAQPDSSFLLVVGVGAIAQGNRFAIPNVYHVEGLKKNLISVSQLAAQHGICFVNKRCEITLSDGTPVGGAFMEDEGNIYVLSYLQVTETEGRGLRFLLDSGASNHMVGDPGLLRDIQYFASPGYATQGDGSELRILGVGTVRTEHFNIPNVQLVEGLTKNLISVGQLDSDHGTCSSFHGNVCKIMLPDGAVLGEAQLEGNGLYMLQSLQLPASTPSQDSRVEEADETSEPAEIMDIYRQMAQVHDRCRSF